LSILSQLATSATVDFGPDEECSASVTIADARVEADSVIVCSVLAVATPDHDPDDYAIEGLTAHAGAIEPGVGFDITACAPNGTWGRYRVTAIH
jgi:hypothetical protein